MAMVTPARELVTSRAPSGSCKRWELMRISAPGGPGRVRRAHGLHVHSTRNTSSLPSM
jgi:hypothetical protein